MNKICCNELYNLYILLSDLLVLTKSTSPKLNLSLTTDIFFDKNFTKTNKKKILYI